MAAPPTLNRLTLQEAVIEYERILSMSTDLSPITIGNYRRDIREFADMAFATHGQDVVLDDLTAEQVDEILFAYRHSPDRRYKDARVTKTRGDGALARFRQSVARMFAIAEVEGWVQVSPMHRSRVKVKSGRVTNLARKALPAPAAAALLDAPLASSGRSAGLTLRDVFILRLLVESGPRVKEICTADRSDIETRPDGSTWLHIRFGKGGKARWVPLGEATVAAYRAYDEQERPMAQPRPGDESGVTVDDSERALLLSWRGRRLTPRDVQRMVERAVSAMPPELRRRVTPHGLRHTAATLLTNSGVADIATVKGILGHENISTTSGYVDETSEHMAAAIRMHPITGNKPKR